jgi:hypothetical protein
MGSKRETLAFVLVLGGCVAAFFHETLFGGKVLSPADALLVSASFRGEGGGDYEPANRLLMDPVLQFQPWLEFNRRMLRGGRLPLWNPYAGCGAPHLANGQSAVFDPFHLLAYLGPTPRAYAWIAAGRLWVAGLGMFWLARSWGLGRWGRWFAGLVYPFCGFVVVWLLFPVTAVAIWMPWLFLATEGIFRARAGGPRAVGALAIAVALVLLGGHIQTSAHVLLAAGCYAVWRIGARRGRSVVRRWVVLGAAGIGLGIALAAVQIVPLGAYLSRSPVWGDRQRERPAWWRLARPRLLDAVCTAIPYAYGSQRRGHPNLARAVGVHNLNESAGGYAGLATAVWMAPLAWSARRRRPRVAFLAGMVAFGLLGAFQVPPVDNLLRALPVLEVTDNRRLTLWVAFGLTLLGGIGLDHLARSPRPAPGWIALWMLGSWSLGLLAGLAPSCEPALRARALEHYRRSAAATPGADPALYRQRAGRQVCEALDFLPRYYGLVAAELGGLAALALALRRAGPGAVVVPAALLALTLAELGGFGFGLNPAIPPELDGLEPPVIARLRRGLPPSARALGLGAELPPNVLMRFGLADPRNYDSIELAGSLAWLEPLYEPSGSARSSRRAVTWSTALGARDRLEDSGVAALVAASPPPAGAFDRVDRVGPVWIAWLDPRPWATAESPAAAVAWERQPGRAGLRLRAPVPTRLVVRESWDPGWRARIDGRPAPVAPTRAGFLAVTAPSGYHNIIVEYDPVEVRIGLAITAGSLLAVILILTGNRPFWIPGITRRGAWTEPSRRVRIGR